jgi:hypothetical protein
VAADLLQVDAVQRVAHGFGRLHGDAQHALGHMVEGHRLDLPVAVLRRPGLAHDLPVARDHVIAAGIERLARQHAHAPVELGREELLDQEQVRALEDGLALLAQLARVGAAHDALGERAVGVLQHARVAHAPLDLVGVDAVGDPGAWRRDLVLLEGLLQEDLVAAAQDRERVVDHRQTLDRRALGEAEGVVVDGRRLADEERVELRQTAVVVARDQLDAEALLLRGAHDLLDGAGVGGREDLGRIVEHGQLVARLLPAPHAEVRAREVLGRGLLQEGPVALRDVARRDRADRRQPPAVLALGELRPQQGRREGLEQARRQAVVGLGQVLAEVDAELEARRPDPGQRVLDDLVELVVGRAHDGAVAHVEHGQEAGEGPVAARGREQRHVITALLIAVGPAQVVDAHPAGAGPLRGREVLARGDDLDPREERRPVLGLVDHHGVAGGH